MGIDTIAWRVTIGLFNFILNNHRNEKDISCKPIFRHERIKVIHYVSCITAALCLTFIVVAQTENGFFTPSHNVNTYTGNKAAHVKYGNQTNDNEDS